MYWGHVLLSDFWPQTARSSPPAERSILREAEDTEHQRTMFHSSIAEAEEVGGDHPKAAMLTESYQTWLCEAADGYRQANRNVVWVVAEAKTWGWKDSLELSGTL